MSSNTLEQDKCAICYQNFIRASEITELRQKGAEGINKSSLERKDRLFVFTGDKVHPKCRQRYINKKNIQTKYVNTVKPTKRSHRVSESAFNSQTDCLFCGITLIPGSYGVSNVKTEGFVTTVIECCCSRLDEWANIVKGRIEYYGHDLIAAKSIYHHSCRSNFRSGFDIPLQYQKECNEKRRKPGRPKDDDQEQAFLKVCHYLDHNDFEQLTISLIQDKMKEFMEVEDSKPFSRRYLKEKLKQRYENNIHFSEQEGLHDIVTMKENTSNILRSYFSNLGNDEQCQKQVIIDTAARLIRSDIKSNIPSVIDKYPSEKCLELESTLSFLPESLRCFLNGVFVCKNADRKVAAIGQAIIQAARPRGVIAPLQLGLAVHVHHLYRSQFLVDTLHALGFSSSYKEVLRFEQNAANSTDIDVLTANVNVNNTTLLFAADNVDHNIITIDGKGTFHGMGIIAALTPGQKKDRIVPRRSVCEEEHFTVKSRIPIIEFNSVKEVRDLIVFEDLRRFNNCINTIDVLWELSLNFKQEVPGWQGMMHIIHQELKHPGKSSVVFLPMIDMYSGDKSCILSTLDFIYKLSMKYEVSPIVTFDQPLYWKAAEIIKTSSQENYLKHIILMLGSFHTFMNLLGAISTLMEGTGLQNIMEVVYSENTVNHMMAGKSVQRAFRGHLLIDRCLNSLIVSQLKENNTRFALLVEEGEKLYSLLNLKQTTVENATKSETRIELKSIIDEKKEELGQTSKTSLLWIKYQKMLQIARSLIKADRTGSWEMHLQAMSDCLPIFAAAGHNNYLKSAYLYLQEMGQLQSTHPSVYNAFCNGLHVIRRSNQFWAGLGSDLVIEQTLMRSLKSSGGLTRGSGMTEEMRALWIMSTPITSQYSDAVQEFCNLTYTTSHQHKEATVSRVKRDHCDLEKINAKLLICSPFSPDPSLRNIVTGVIAKEDVNVHNFEIVGANIIRNMAGKQVFSVSFKRKDRVTTLADDSKIKIEKGRTIDPALLYQRFLIMSKTGDIPLEKLMDYELSIFPASLFEAKDTIRKGDKAQLAHAIEDYTSKESETAVMNAIPPSEYHVLDGGSLLHRLPWKKNDTYGAIARSYGEFTLKKYGKATVVFDGYESGPSIKDNTHQRRGQINHASVSLTSTTEFVGKKDDILSIRCNKLALIRLISEELRERGCIVINALGDADVDIVKETVKLSEHGPTTLIGEDTDLLILLLFYAQPNNSDIYFRSDRSTIRKVFNITEIKRVLGHEVCEQLLFIHAFTGCDTTSRLYGIGKKPAFQKLISREQTIQDCAKLFLTPNRARILIESLGCKAMAVLFGGKNTDTLTSLRCHTLRKRVVSATSFVNPERLPPTESSTNYHCLRVYYQIMVWTGQDNEMNAVNWGWKLYDNLYVPIMSDKPIAPECILHMLHCNCTTACRSMRCSCTRYGLPCTSACGPCQTGNCENKYNIPVWEEDCNDDFY